jgi:hypothetical protein
VRVGTKRAGLLAAVAGVVVACVPTILLQNGPPAGGASQVVDQTGGVVTTNEGTTLVIPPGALTAQTTITITLRPDAAAPAGVTPVTAAHQFGPEGQTFLVPVCITLAFEPELLPAGTTEQGVVLYSAPQDGGPNDYQPLETSAVDRSHVIGMTTHFSNVVAAYGGAQELPPDAGVVGCDAGDGGDSAADGGT